MYAFTREVRYSELSSLCVPFITNIEKLEEGEELILEVAQKEKQQKPRARTWRQVEQEEKIKKSSAKSPKQK